MRSPERIDCFLLDDDALELIRGEISAATFEQWEKIWFMFMSRTAIEHFQGKPDLGLR